MVQQYLDVRGFGFFAFRGGGGVVATGCGVARPGSGKVSSYRAEAYCVLAALRNLFAEHRAAGVDLYLHNKAVNDIFNTPMRRAMAAADVWDKI